MNTKFTGQTLSDFVSKKAKKELWGDMSEKDIETMIQTIENHANYWNENIHGLVFCFVRHNTGFNVCIFYPTSRRLTTTGEFGKLGANLRNGTVVDTHLLHNITPVERGKLSQTIAGAFVNIAVPLHKVEDWAADNWGGDNGLDNLDDWLPISLAKSFLVPNDTLDYLKKLSTELSGNSLRDEVWEVVRNQIHFLSGWQKARVIDRIVKAIQNDNSNVIPLNKFMDNLSILVGEMQEISMHSMAQQVQQLQTQLDKIDYSYARLGEFQVPINTTQTKRMSTQKVKRSDITILCFDGFDS